VRAHADIPRYIYGDSSHVRNPIPTLELLEQSVPLSEPVSLDRVSDHGRLDIAAQFRYSYLIRKVQFQIFFWYAHDIYQKSLDPRAADLIKAQLAESLRYEPTSVRETRIIFTLLSAYVEDVGVSALPLSNRLQKLHEARGSHGPIACQSSKRALFAFRKLVHPSRTLIHASHTGRICVIDQYDGSTPYRSHGLHLSLTPIEAIASATTQLDEHIGYT